MNKFINVLFVMICVSCATSSKHSGSSNKVVKQEVRRNIKLSLKSDFNMLLGMKYANLSISDTLKGNYKECSFINPGEGNDPYQKRVLCYTFFALAKSHNVSLVRSSSEYKNSEFYEITFSLNENQGTGSNIWSWINLGTLTIIPYRGKTDYKVTVKKMKSGKMIDSIESNTHFIEWRSIFLLPAMPFLEGHQEATEHSLAYLLNDVRRFIL